MGDRIGIETIFRSVLLSNYGSFWQHFSLRYVLKQLGFNPFRCEKESPIAELLILLMPLRRLRIKLLEFLSLRDRSTTVAPFCLGHRVRFLLDYLRRIGPLFEKQTNADYYVSGGDSVWCLNGNNYYQLDKPSHARKISYAVSSSWDKLSTETWWINNIKFVGSVFHRVSVRENRGCEVIEGICGKVGVVVVCDPVFLIERAAWLKLIPMKKFGVRNQMLYYAVNVWERDSLCFESVHSCALSLGVKLKCVGIQGAEQFFPRDYKYDMSPTRFLKEVVASQYVVTNSFHGLVFAILFHKQFVFIPQVGMRYGNQNQRQYELLEHFNMQGRIVTGNKEPNDIRDKLLAPVDWNCVDERIAKDRERGIQWLKEALL